MKSQSLGIKAVLAVAALLVVLVLVFRPTPPTEVAPAPEVVSGTPLKTSDRVRQRLQQLSETRSTIIKEQDSGMAKAGAPLQQRAAQRKLNSNTQAIAPDTGNDSDDFEDDPDDIPALKKVALQDADPERRLTAVTLLGASEDPEVIPILTEVLKDQDEEVRMAALESLADFTDEAPVEAIEVALDDSVAENRFEALSILGDIGGDRARAAVEKALNDPDEEVRSLAEGILDLEDDEPTPSDQAPEQQPPAH
jgi:HEAT repeat protein